MGTFRFGAARGCAVFSLALFTQMAFAQPAPGPKDQERKTWNTLHAIHKEMSALRALVAEAANHPNDPPLVQKSQRLYRQHLQRISTACDSIGFHDYFFKIKIVDRVRVESADFSGFLHGRRLGADSITLAVTQPAATAKLEFHVQMPGPWFRAPNGTIRVNGKDVIIGQTDTYATMINRVLNAAGSEDDTESRWTPVGDVTLEHLIPGSQFKFRIEDPDGLLTDTPLLEAAGTDAGATATAPVMVGYGMQQETFTLRGGLLPGDSGLILRDTDGNRITLTYAGGALSSDKLVLREWYIHFDVTSFGGAVIVGRSLSTLDFSTAQALYDDLVIVDESIWQICQSEQAFLLYHPNFHP